MQVCSLAFTSMSIIGQTIIDYNQLLSGTASDRHKRM